MSLTARSHITSEGNSFETGRETAVRLTEGTSVLPKLVVVYTTVNHDQHAFLRGLRGGLGEDVPVVGCSAQGVIGAGRIREEGYGASALALGGDAIDVAHGSVQDIQVDTLEKGKRLGRELVAQLPAPPKIVVLHFDPICGVDIGLFMEGLHSEVECEVVGGGAAHSFYYESLQTTYQHHGDKVLSRAAVGFALSGGFSTDMDICHGCASVGVDLTVTRSEGNRLFELDHRPAVEVWSEICGPSETVAGHLASLAIGIPVPDAKSEDEYLIRAAYSADPESGGIVLGSHVPVGTRIMLHHRTVENVLDGAARMGARLRARLQGTTPRAVFAFECGARARPFLGEAATLSENLALQEAVGGAGAAWIGMMPWGEIFPMGGRPTFHNYSYPLLVLGE
jgi:small ligand-binding sensory domain FIST